MPTHDTPSAPAAASESPVERARARLMALSLRALLDRVRGARDVLPHLAALEAALLQHGLAVLDRATKPSLLRMASQLSSLPVDDHDAVLIDLRQRLHAALRAPDAPPSAVAPAPPVRKPAPAPPAPAPRAGASALPSRSSVDAPDEAEAGVYVQEMSHSAFMRIMDGTDATLPMGLQDAPPMADRQPR